MDKKTMIYVGVGIAVVAIGVYFYNKNKGASTMSTESSSTPPKFILDENQDSSGIDGVVPISGGRNRFKCSTTGAIFNGGSYDSYQTFVSNCRANGGTVVELATYATKK